MVLLDAARRGAPAPRLARWMLAAGISATLAANVLSGVRFGAVGAVVAAWPALAVVGSYELLMIVIRGTGVPAPAGAEPEPATAGQDVPADAASAARVALAASITAGEPLSQRELARRYGIPRSRAAVIAREAAVAAA